MGDRFDLIIPPTRIASLFAGSVESRTISVSLRDSINSEKRLVSFKGFPICTNRLYVVDQSISY
jgi:hypothetical protein